MRSDHKHRTLNEYQELLIDAQWQLVKANGGLFKQKNIGGRLDTGESVGKALKGFWSPRVRDISSLALNRGETGRIVQELNRNGAYLALEIIAAPQVRDAQVVGVLLTVRDVTVAKRLERQKSLNKKMKTISQLASEIVHKMNNPIAAILNQIGGILVEDPSAMTVESLRSGLQDIQEQLYSVSLVTNALTAFSMETNTDFKLIQANVVIENAINLLSLFDFQKKVEYRIQLDENLPRILGSEVTLEQGLVNIFKNAIEALPEQGGVLNIISRVDEQFHDFINIAVIDNGVGIPPEHLEFVVDPFFTTKNGSHNGLGLSVCYGIISNHNGSIEITSTPDEGTTVNIMLPIARV